ncbi:uncharacterized protein PFL1_02105 [Pseudozyma flocculosa PF-1]|uniref:t-SNARE coiled-coil homology domain-containing protein n=1 Tax=Pseudozyma flocculosa TaxID=84751 RepID=A0A5C3F165_9BASI|nr:uncharacterized protein PFL1_02105 [Pseudozyma flocculosa PF-1]EPQ30581.1 hypothetical protein PFL1_02105 [Pseudozyma flocculosa PF-1]SPO37676.1 uncharacterized protein PSFLO_03152 [Pseudozyma flocculosa]
MSSLAAPPPPLAGPSSSSHSTSTPSSSSARPGANARQISALVRHIPALTLRTDDLCIHASANQGREQTQAAAAAATLLADLDAASARLVASGMVVEHRSRLQRQIDADIVRTKAVLESASKQQSRGATSSATVADSSLKRPRFTDTTFGSSSSRPTQPPLDQSRATLTPAPFTADDDEKDDDDDDDDDLEDDSEAESELTDLDAYDLEPRKPLGGLKPTAPSPAAPKKWSEAADQDQDVEAELDEYDRAAASRRPRGPQGTPTTSSSSPTGPNAPATASPPPPANQSDTILQSDRATHEALSSELLRMASVLKTNSLAFADALERDRMLVEKAGDGLSSNLDLMTRTRGRLGIYSKKARSMGWLTLGSIAVVVVSWVFMFFVIRLT